MPQGLFCISPGWWGYQGGREKFPSRMTSPPIVTHPSTHPFSCCESCLHRPGLIIPFWSVTSCFEWRVWTSIVEGRISMKHKDFRGLRASLLDVFFVFISKALEAFGGVNKSIWIATTVMAGECEQHKHVYFYMCSHVVVIIITML